MPMDGMQYRVEKPADIQRGDSQILQEIFVTSFYGFGVPDIQINIVLTRQDCTKDLLVTEPPILFCPSSV